MSELIVSENDVGDADPVTLDLYDFYHTLVIKRGSRKVLRLDAKNAVLLRDKIDDIIKRMAK